MILGGITNSGSLCERSHYVYIAWEETETMLPEKYPMSSV